ncbi:DNA polymerase III subunit alpha [Streptomyces sp. JJ66]|uniref:DNA polymerase III subunit alpha n=1 Tax=Streptomyces sp. JJ66 TaxID=2803843 RepID=UPI001C59BAB0|nr:DNA polymerase III subunit alpha [Streptomyces sp. JJ66]MBW1602217.1 DNA polymerase III subunit alpha [Streptomyces sp. JJ66]
MGGFTHLHAVSGCSARYGASHPEQLAERAAERGMDALALTDRDTLGGAVRFAQACERVGVRALYGVELAVAQAHADAPGRRRPPARGGAFVDEPGQRVVFLARDGARGWAELCRLVTAAHRDVTAGAPVGMGTRPELAWADAAADGVTVLLGPSSDVGQALAAGRPDKAARHLRAWREVYGDALRLEVVGSAPRRQAARMLGLAAEQGVVPVLTNAVRYADAGLGPVADVLDAARRLVPIDPAKGLDNGERWLKGPEAMADVARGIAEAAGFRRELAHRLLARTEETAAQCRVDGGDDLGIGSAHFPEPYLVGAHARTADRVLRSRCAGQMLVRRYDRDRHRWERLERELGVIERHGFASYFLTVARVVDDVRALGVRVAARGSGAGSLVNHLLGITTADPVEHGLLMERFLSEHRRALPDIDIDVESARRLEVYRAIFQRFGEQRVATVAMPETYRVRHAVRDVGAALGLDPAEVDRLAKAFPHIRARDARSALAELPELRGVDAERYGPRIWELVEALDGLVRGMAMHPCGVLLSHAGLRERTPVAPTSGEGFAMSQFDKDDVERLGLLKLDVLGVRMQSSLAYAVEEVQRTTGTRLDLDALDLVGGSDEKTYQLIRSAETLGCFQIESPGQRDLIGRLQPSTFHDLVVDISLFRPGPVAADMVRPFIEARHGRAPVRYPHADLEPALRETRGVVVFHEQIIHVVAVMTGCDRSFADETRRALADPGLQPSIKAWFERHAARRGYAGHVIEQTWEIVEAFGAYGFCKAHAVAFAVPTYQSAWLKAHHPAAFYAGVLTHDPGMYPKRLLLADARRRGVPILPLDVNRSDVPYRIELESESGCWGVRLALGEVRGISETDAARIAAGQPYRSLHDLMERARPSRPVAENLARAGALDAFGGNRRDLLLHLAELHRGRRRGSDAPQLPFDGAPQEPRAASGGPATGTRSDGPAAPPAGLPDLDENERLGAELGILGLDASRHLMGDHRSFLDELAVRPARALTDVPHGETVLVAGAKVATQTPAIRSGKRVIFVSLDDGTGLTDLAFFEDSHAACAHTVFHSWLLLVRGVVQRRGPRGFSVVGSAAWNLTELAELRRTGGLDAVATRLAEQPGAAPDGGSGRRIRLATGYEMHPWADLRPAGESPSSPQGGRKLWHSSPGSAG